MVFYWFAIEYARFGGIVAGNAEGRRLCRCGMGMSRLGRTRCCWPRKIRSSNPARRDHDLRTRDEGLAGAGKVKRLTPQLIGSQNRDRMLVGLHPSHGPTK